MSQSKCNFNVDGNCSTSEDLIRLYDIRHQKFSEHCFPGARSAVEIIFLREDLYGQRKVNLRQVFICVKHKDDHLNPVYASRGKCDLCIPCFKKVSAGSSSRNITVDQSIGVFRHLGYRHSYGRLICKQCRSEVSKYVDEVGMKSTYEGTFPTDKSLLS